MREKRGCRFTPGGAQARGRTGERRRAGGYRIIKQCSPSASSATALRSDNERRRRAGQIRGKSASAAGGGNTSVRSLSRSSPVWHLIPSHLIRSIHPGPSAATERSLLGRNWRSGDTIDKGLPTDLSIDRASTTVSTRFVTLRGARRCMADEKGASNYIAPPPKSLVAHFLNRFDHFISGVPC